MRVTKEVAALHREAIVSGAARTIREKGPEALGIADVMGAVGLTHGGFYGHFASRQALLTEAVARAIGDSAADWARYLSANVDDPLGGLVAGALADGTGVSDAIAGLSGDMSRAAPETRSAYREGLEPVIAMVADAMPTGTDDPRGEALGTIAALVGAMVLARAVDDPELAEGFRAAGRRLFGL